MAALERQRLPATVRNTLAERPTDLEILAVSLVDLRATLDSMRRAVTNAQASVEQFRHTRNQDQIDDIASCFVKLTNEACTVTESVAQAEPQLAALRVPR